MVLMKVAYLITRIDTVNFIIDESGYRFYIKTQQGLGSANAISGQITNQGTDNGTLTYDEYAEVHIIMTQIQMLKCRV